MIIPTVNNNAECVEELQGKFIDLKNATEHEINEFETNITALYNQLHDYVENYFDNLDVQEEINNKLDAMAEAGTLQSIIYEYLNSVALFCYDNLAGMKAATNFVNGSYAKTLGYTAKNDLGGAVYKIRTKTNDDTTDEMTLIALYDTTLVGELVKTPIMNVKQFGAKGDGSTDDTAAIQKALDTCKNVVVTAGTYMINAITHINLNSNNKLTLDNDATIKAITNGETTYGVLYLDNVQNVEISGGTIQGERTTHTGETGEWGHCIDIRGGSSNIYVHDITVKDSWGDGIYFNTCSNIKTARVKVDNARRNGYSIIAMTNYLSEGDVINHTNGTAPAAGIDIEPNTNDDVIDNIVFNNFTCTNNQNDGFMVALYRTNTYPSHITVNNFFASGNRRGINCQNDASYKCIVTFNSPVIEDCSDYAVLVNNEYNTYSKLIINDPVIETYATSGQKREGIYCTSPANSEGGDVYITNPRVKGSQGTNTAAIRIDSRGASYPWHTAMVKNPIFLDGLTIQGDYGNMQFFDDLEILTFNNTANVALKDEWYSVCTNTGASASIRYLLDEATTFINQTIKFLVTGDQNITVFFRNQNIHPLSSTTGQTVTLAGTGSSITVKKISSTDWIVLNQIGGVTIA